MLSPASSSKRGRVRGVEVRGERIDAPHVVLAVPWFALRTVFGPAPPPELEPVIAAASATDSMPIVTVNLWYDRRVMDELFVGLPGREMQWVFDKRLAFGGDASHLSLVSSGATRLASLPAEELTSLAAAEIGQALPRARGATLVRATVIREKHATFSLAPGQPVRPARRHPSRASTWRATGPTPVCPERSRVRSSADTRAANRIRALRRRAKTAVELGRAEVPLQPFMKSIVLHYQEIALKGKNRPWFVARLVRNLRARDRRSGRRATFAR